MTDVVMLHDFHQTSACNMGNNNNLIAYEIG